MVQRLGPQQHHWRKPSMGLQYPYVICCIKYIYIYIGVSLQEVPHYVCGDKDLLGTSKLATAWVVLFTRWRNGGI